jgi:hypothetical protein
MIMRDFGSSLPQLFYRFANVEFVGHDTSLAVY